MIDWDDALKIWEFCTGNVLLMITAISLLRVISG